MKKLFTVLLILVVSAGFLAAEGAQEAAAAADEYPNKPIQIIVPWGAGGRTDINARMFASVAPKYLGQPVVEV